MSRIRTSGTLNMNRPAMDEQEFGEKVENFAKKFMELWEAYEKANPSYFVASGLQIIRIAIQRLKASIEDPEENTISWDSPILTLTYPVELEGELTPTLFSLTPDDLRDEKNVAEALVSHLARAKAINTLRGITEDAIILDQGKEWHLLLPPHIDEELKSLDEGEIQKKIQALYDPEPFSLDFRASESHVGDKNDIPWSSIRVQLNPLLIQEKAARAYFPIVVRLSLEGINPAEWSNQVREELWEAILHTIDDLTPEERFDFMPKLLPEFYWEPVTITEYVASQHVDKFRKHIGSLVRLQAGSVNETGQFASVVGPPGMPTWVTPEGLEIGQAVSLQDLMEHKAQANVFRKHGEFWMICYEGKLVTLKDSKGPHYIAHLLGHPGQALHVLELMEAHESQKAGHVSETYGRMSSEQLEKYGLAKSRPRDAGRVLDAKAISEYKRRLAELYEDLKEAETYNDIGRIEIDKKEMDEIGTQLETACGIGGRARTIDDPTERARKSVGNCIVYSLNKIRKVHPALALHLQQSIKRGISCSYSPPEPISWVT